MNKCDPSKPLYIQEGEGDCLSVIEAGYTNVVSVPNGSQNMQWIEENWDWLSQFPKIIIWSDNDEPGKKMRKEAIHRLGIIIYINIVRIKFIVLVHYVVENHLEQKRKKFLLVNC